MDQNNHLNKVIETLRVITGAQQPRVGQVDAVKHLVHDGADTVLIAATGYGKSAVLYAFSALTSKITVQIVPLTKLGENQREEISRKVPNSKPVWIDGDTHLKNPKVWDELRDGNYTHILLSPEQAVNPKFKAILRDPDFHKRIGLFAIDELHMVGEWREFRKEFTYLYSLRSLLPRRLPWFGCTGTLDRVNQDYILKHAGFDLNQLVIVRTSVDRPEISLVIQPLMRGYMKDYRRLHFLLEGATPNTVASIPKTIIYIDSKPQLIKARWTLLKHLRDACGFSSCYARKVIRRYDADVRDADKDIIFKDFANEHTDCRIVFATVSLGMGMDLPDVIRVVQFGLPPGFSLSDLWQRIRRAMRNKQIVGQKQGMATVFVPYWAFDFLGVKDKPKQLKPVKSKQPRLPNKHIGAAAPHTPGISSRLREMTLAEQDSDNDTASQGSQASHVSLLSQASQISQVVEADEARRQEAEAAVLKTQGLFDLEIQHKFKWSKAEIVCSEKLDPYVKGFFNASCFRKYMLNYLQEPTVEEDPHLEFRHPVEKAVCCNACNHSLGLIPPMEPRNKGQEKPSVASLPWFALEELAAWCKEQAQELAPSRRFEISGTMWMEQKLQYNLARLFGHDKKKKGLPFTDVATLVQKFPVVKEWEHLENRGVDLVAFLLEIVPRVYDKWEASKASKAAAKKAANAGNSVDSGVEADGSLDESHKRAAGGSVALESGAKRQRSVEL